MEPSDLPTPNPPKDLKSEASGHKAMMPSIQFPYGLKNSVAAYQEFLAKKLSSYYQEAPLFGKHEGLVISSTPWGKAVHCPGRTPVHSNNPVIEQEHSCIVQSSTRFPANPATR